MVEIQGEGYKVDNKTKWSEGVWEVEKLRLKKKKKMKAETCKLFN